MRKLIYAFSLLILLVSFSSCKTLGKEYVYIEPKYPKLKTIDEIVGNELMESVKVSPDLIAEPQNVGDVIKNLEEYRKSYISWKLYALALEEYCNNLTGILGDNSNEVQL